MNWLIYTYGVLLGILTYACFNFRQKLISALVLILGAAVGPQFVIAMLILAGLYEKPSTVDPFHWIGYVAASLIILAISAAIVLLLHIFKRLKGTKGNN